MGDVTSQEMVEDWAGVLQTGGGAANKPTPKSLTIAVVTPFCRLICGWKTSHNHA
jgi:hypothetical protein